jgi:glycosyltransferase involved in cell wall biosynthesis
VKILFVTRSTLAHAGPGGMEVHAARLMEGLARRGHAVVGVTTAHPGGAPAVESGGVAVHHLAGTRPGVYSREWEDALVAWIEREQPRQAFEVVLAESGAAYGYLARARARLGVPVVFTCHGFAGWSIAGRMRELGTLAAWRQLASMSAAWLAERAAAWRNPVRYDAVVCVSEPLARAFARAHDYPAGTVTCVPNGIDPERFAAAAARRDAVRAGLELAPGDVVALASGRLDPDKGVHLAVQALAVLRARHGPAAAPVRLVVAGDGPAAPALRALVDRTGLAGCVRFTGHVDPERVPDLHAASDLFIFPTLLNESFGLGVLEAMAAGRPVVAPLTGGIPMLLEDRATGLACAAGSADALARALWRLVQDPDLRDRLGREGARRARERFTEERMIDGFEQVLSSVCRGRLRP